ncbi:hypothetical protein EYZ11_009271 [Aspergillus tanneri]|uniref:Uncharacterized protein n=1 Tax=Aspergillus tanneri TaxID=1220188 RepID=A0A4S3JDS9_9EURO|nr:hypothetical protein EYZ11_009271 [Aspergillus tanneri]
MLASMPQMETVRSLPRNPDVVPRHPSAEDLDAAQQLISSAQAGREHPVERNCDDTGTQGFEADHTRRGQDLVDTPAPYPSSETMANAPVSEKSSSSPKSQKDTSFLGHSCRQVRNQASNRPLILSKIPRLPRLREDVMALRGHALAEETAMVPGAPRAVMDARRIIIESTSQLFEAPFHCMLGTERRIQLATSRYPYLKAMCRLRTARRRLMAVCWFHAKIAGQR